MLLFPPEKHAAATRRTQQRAAREREGEMVAVHALHS
jgi:hypothetical protein